MSLFNILKISQKNVYDGYFFDNYKLTCVIYQCFVEFFRENVMKKSMKNYILYLVVL